MRTIERRYTVTATTNGESVATDGLTADNARALATALQLDPKVTVTVTRTGGFVRRVAGMVAAWLGLCLILVAIIQPEMVVAGWDLIVEALRAMWGWVR